MVVLVVRMEVFLSFIQIDGGACGISSQVNVLKGILDLAWMTMW